MSVDEQQQSSLAGAEGPGEAAQAIIGAKDKLQVEPLAVKKPESYQELLGKAKAEMQQENFGGAVDLYAHALELMNAENLDQLSLPFAPLYYAYGISLLSHSIQQSSVLGDAVPETEDPEPTESHKEEGDPKNDSDNDSEQSVAMDIEAAHEAMVEKTLEVIDDLQVAWEVLDTARIIYEKALETDAAPAGDARRTGLSLSLANVYLALGDVSLESDAFDTAAADFGKAVALRRAVLPVTDRAISEGLFKLGMAAELGGRLEDARQVVAECLTLLKARHAALQERLASSAGQAEGSCNDDADNGKAAAEVEDLAALFPDIEAKLEELSAAALTNPSDPQAVLAGESSSTTAAAAAPLDISNLVKKKPIPQPSASSSSSPSN